ncbi:MAG TPA: TonB-dependent receptor [Hyphomonadaceae bacterium]|nr:TonB-dependent receptor [Hyphomonadaceae bacterium]
MRGRYTAASCIALAAATAMFAGPAFAQAGPVDAVNPATPSEDDIVRVYGDRVPNDPGAYSVVSKEEIQDVQANHPAEILNTVPGVNVQMNSGQEMLVAIRSPVLPAGAGQGSFLILEDGVPTRASGFGNVNALFELHHETAEDIEVVRGPGSVRYGSNAVHGLINVIDPEPGAQTGETLVMSANTLQRYRADATANFDVGGIQNWAGLSITDDGGWRDASSVGLEKLTVRSKVGGEDWKAIATLAAVNLNQETAGFLVGHDAYKDKDFAITNMNPEAYRDAWAARANVRFEQQIGRDQLTITPFAITQRMIFIQHFLPDQSTEKNGQDSVGVLTRYDFGPDNVRWSVGADVQLASGSLEEIQSLPSFGGTPANRTFPQGIHYDYDVDTTMFGVYGELNWQMSQNWKMLAGIRGETHNYDYVTHKAPGVYGRYRIAPSRSDNYNLFTPKLGFVYSGFSGGIVYMNYARGERAPQTSDQYRLQNLQTTDRLDVETLDSYELGTRGSIGRNAHFDVAIYHMTKDHFFFRDSDGLNVPNGKTRQFGLEAEVDGRFGEFAGGEFVWNANLSWSDDRYAFSRKVAAASEVITDGNKIDTAPDWLGDAGFGWQNDIFKLELSTEYVGKYFTDAANLHSYPGHVIAHLRGSWKLNDKLEAFGIVRNITDKRYADRADFASNQDRYFPGEPVNLTVGVRVRN